MIGLIEPRRRWTPARIALMLTLALLAPCVGRASQGAPETVPEAAARGDAAALATLLRQGLSPDAWLEGDNALTLAMHSHCAACVRELLDAGASFPMHDADALTEGYPSYFDHLGQADPQTLKVFAQHGLDLTTRNIRHDTLLHVAAAAGSAASVRWLLRHGLLANARNEDGSTPLMAAAAAGNLATADALLAAGARTGPHDHLGRTAKQVAADAKHSDLVALLGRHGAKEYLGAMLPASRYDPELVGNQQRDVTGDFYTRLPFLPSGLRFFAVRPQPSATPATAHRSPVPPMFAPTTPLPAPTYYAVVPPKQVVKLDQAGAFASFGIHLRNAAQALQYVRVVTGSEPYGALFDPEVAGLKFDELPTSMENNCLSFDMKVLRRIGAKPAHASAMGGGKSLTFRIVRYMKPAGWPGFGQTVPVPTVYRVVEQVDAHGHYAVVMHQAMRIRGLALHNVCAYR